MIKKQMGIFSVLPKETKSYDLQMSNLNMLQNTLRACSNTDCWATSEFLIKFADGQKICISNKFLGDNDTAGP